MSEEENNNNPTGPNSSNKSKLEDCMTCRVVGTTVFALTGLYVLGQRRGTTGATRHIMTGIAGASFAASALRFFYVKDNPSPEQTNIDQGKSL